MVDDQGTRPHCSEARPVKTLQTVLGSAEPTARARDEIYFHTQSNKAPHGAQIHPHALTLMRVRAYMIQGVEIWSSSSSALRNVARAPLSVGAIHASP